MPWPDSARYELRHGEVVRLPPPKFSHMEIQENLRRLLDAAAAGPGRVYIEFAFRPKGERDYRVADVAYATKEHRARTNRESYFEGSPELVAEILSPSNTAVEIADKRAICFETGSREFWVIDPKRRQIEVFTGAASQVYKPGESIQPHFGGGIQVDAVFDNA